MAKSLRTSTSTASGTVPIPTGLATGDQCVIAAWSDTASATLTSPASNGDSNTWTLVAGGSELPAASTLYVWRCDSITSVPANFTVGGATIGGIVCQAVNPGGETAGTASNSTLASSTVAGSGLITSNAVNASSDSYTFIFYSADDTSTITTAPTGMTQLSRPTVSAGELVGYVIADANNASYTNSLTWATLGTERMAVAVSFPYTNAGPTINTQPTAQTARLNGEPAPTATFTISATTSGGALSYQWEQESGVGSGSYGSVTNGSGVTWSGGTSATLTGTFTATTLTGRRIRCVVTDSNGSTTSTAVTLTVLTGPVLSAYSGTTNGSGVVSVNLTSDDPLTTNGEVYRITATARGQTWRVYVRTT